MRTKYCEMQACFAHFGIRSSGLSLQLRLTGGESGIVFRPISEITATMEKSFYPFVIADTFRIAAMKFDGG
jgi:hypothetical protein